MRYDKSRITTDETRHDTHAILNPGFCPVLHTQRKALLTRLLHHWKIIGFAAHSRWFGDAMFIYNMQSPTNYLLEPLHPRTWYRLLSQPKLWKVDGRLCEHTKFRLLFQMALIWNRTEGMECWAGESRSRYTERERETGLTLVGSIILTVRGGFGGDVETTNSPSQASNDFYSAHTKDLKKLSRKY